MENVDWTYRLDLAKLLIMHFNAVYTYSGNHLTHLVRINGIVYAFTSFCTLWHALNKAKTDCSFIFSTLVS